MNVGATSQDATPVISYLAELIKDYFTSSKKTALSFMSWAKHCSQVIKYTTRSFYNLKAHYKKKHTAEQLAGFTVALKGNLHDEVRFFHDSIGPRP